MAEIIVTAMAGLAVSVALWGLWKHQLYLWRLNRRMRSLSKLRRRGR